MISNGLNVCFKDLNVYCNEIYGVYYWFIFIILELYIIFWKLDLNMKKRLHNHMVNVQMDKKHQIMVQYQTKIIFKGIYVSKKMLLLQ